MSTENRTGEILKLLNELIDLVRANGKNKVENHTHHHYPASPNYYSPQHNPFGTGSTATIMPGTTATWSTNDPPPDDTNPTPE